MQQVSPKRRQLFVNLHNIASRTKFIFIVIAVKSLKLKFVYFCNTDTSVIAIWQWLKETDMELPMSRDICILKVCSRFSPVAHYGVNWY
jgi:hypothetical protein